MTESASSRPDASRWTMIFALIGLALPLMLGGVYLARRPLFWLTIKYRHSKATKLLLSIDRQLANDIDGLAREPLFFAVHFGDLYLISALIAHGADVNARDGVALTTAIGRNPGCIPLLLQHGAQPKQRHLVEAASLGEAETVQALLEYNSDLQADLYKALRKAASAGSLETVELLLSKGAYLNVSNALTPAIIAGRMNIAKFLLERDVDKRIDMNFALIIAIMTESVCMTELLLKYGARFKLNDNRILQEIFNVKNLNSPNFAQIIHLLAKNGADWSALSPEARVQVEQVLAQSNPEALPSDQEPKTAN
jgi:ankyrin repeat protein